MLSLDAPIVAVVWQIFFARCFGVALDFATAILLGLTVWLIYSADRTFDAWRGENNSARHSFYQRHWKELFPVWLLVLAVSGWLAATQLRHGLLLGGSLVLASVGLYFALVHSEIVQSETRRWLKEGMVGVLFALGASLVVWERVKTLADLTTILLFSGLCWINCMVIQKWEGDGTDWSPMAAALLLAGAAGVLLCVHRPLLGGAEMASSFAFVALDKARAKLSTDGLRVLADVALLSPVFFLPVIR